MKSLKGKAIVFLADGMADEPVEALGGKTPLEAVDTPYMDSIARRRVGNVPDPPRRLPHVIRRSKHVRPRI